MMIEAIIVSSALVATLAACSSSTNPGNNPGSSTTRGKYPTNVETNFLNSCESSGGDVTRCGCTLGWFESNASLTQFLADEDQVNNGGTPNDIKLAMAAC